MGKEDSEDIDGSDSFLVFDLDCTWSFNSSNGTFSKIGE
jgi:hypothetical protein